VEKVKLPPSQLLRRSLHQYSPATTMTSVELNNGLRMPLVGLGTWKSNPGEVSAAVFEAIRVGYRHIDAAWVYKNQDEVGEGINKAISEGIVKREDLWVTSKLWNHAHATAYVEASLRETLSQLKLDYLDLFLIHWPVTTTESKELTPPYSETWAAMESVLEKGLTRSIGVSNMTVKKLEAMKGEMMSAFVSLHAHLTWLALAQRTRRFGPP
jgi:diketogulonate reductase-like aldo/keto reductase